MGNLNDAIVSSVEGIGDCNDDQNVSDVLFDGTIESAKAFLYHSHHANITHRKGFLPEGMGIVFSNGDYVLSFIKPEKSSDEFGDLDDARRMLRDRFEKERSVVVSLLRDEPDDNIKREVMKWTPHYFLLRLQSTTEALFALHTATPSPHLITFKKWYAILRLFDRIGMWPGIIKCASSNVYLNRLLFDPFSYDILIRVTIRVLDSKDGGVHRFYECIP